LLQDFAYLNRLSTADSGPDELLRRAFLHLFKRGQRRCVEAAVTADAGIDDVAAAERVVRVADDEPVALDGGHRFGQPHLSPGRLAGSDFVCAQQEQAAFDLGRARVERDLDVVSDGP
jgi:hypothetical protein